MLISNLLGAVSYADDIVLLARTVKTLKILIIICELYSALL